MDTDINIYVNSKPQKLPLQAGIKDLFDAISIGSIKGIAVAVNNNVVPKSEWDNCILKTGDKVVVIKATQGG